MRPPLRAIAILSTALILGACSGDGGATNAPTSTPAPATTAAPAPTAPAATDTARICTEPADAATTVEAGVGGFEWGPVAAKVDDVITWTNGDGAPHKVVLDDGSCSMSGNIAGGGTRSLVFSVAGTFPFHCGVHSSMKGTIVIN